MSFLKRLLGGKRKGAGNTIETFWDWFKNHEKEYRDISDKPMDKREKLLDILLENLKPYNPYLKCLLGKNKAEKNELIITADGDIALFAKVEKLIEAAPCLDGWKFIAHKPSCGFGIAMDMHGHRFDDTTLHFYPVTEPQMPDEIAIIITHPAYNQDDAKQFETAVNIYLENVLGELAVSTDIDSFEVGAETKDAELIPITKLPEYLNWRQKEFVEKNEHLQADDLSEEYSVIEGTYKSGKPVIAVIRSDTQYYESKSAFPWLLHIEMGYKGTENGFPSTPQLEESRKIQDDITTMLADYADFHELGTKTFDHFRSIYYYLHDYRLASEALHEHLEKLSSSFDITFFITKDKYWQRMEEFYSN